jgi:uncharacterized protein
MWLTALILGFAGSLHCVGMCSPLVMAVTSFNSRVVRNKVIYNGGRLFTYGLLGAIISLFGVMINFSEFQFVLTIAVALTLIVMGFSGISGVRMPLITPLLVKFTTLVKGWFSAFITRKTVTGMWVMGMLNGLLPCGLSYLALTYCLTLQGPTDGFQFMLLFGAGTLPAMVGLTSVLAWVVRRFNLDLSKVSRVSFIVIGALVLARLFLFQHHGGSHVIDQVGIIFCQ